MARREVNESVKDPVCGMDVTPGRAAGGSAEHAGTTYWFCSPSCRDKFIANPSKYVTAVSAASGTPAPAPKAADTRIYTCPMHPEVRQVGPGSCPKCGMALEPLEPVAEDEGPSAELGDMTRRFWIGVALTAPLLALEMGGMAMPEVVGRLNVTARLWIELMLAAPVVLWGGWPFFVRGWQSVVTHSLNMFTLIALGTGTAFGYSVFAVLFPDTLPHGMRHGGAPPVYFEAAAVITTLVLLGQVLELRARSATSGAIPEAAGRWERGGRAARGRADRRPPAGAAGRARARGRGGPRGPERGGRVHAHRRADSRGEGARRARDRRHGEWDGELRDARRARGGGHPARPDRPHGRRGPAQPRAHPAPGRPGLGVVRPRRDRGGGTDRAGVGPLWARAAPGLCAGERGRRPDHRVPVCARPRHADVDHGGDGAGRPGGGPDQECRGPRDPRKGRHAGDRQDRHPDRRQAAPRHGGGGGRRARARGLESGCGPGAGERAPARRGDPGRRGRAGRYPGGGGGVPLADRPGRGRRGRGAPRGPGQCAPPGGAGREAGPPGRRRYVETVRRGPSWSRAMPSWASSASRTPSSQARPRPSARSGGKVSASSC